VRIININTPNCRGDAKGIVDYLCSTYIFKIVPKIHNLLVEIASYRRFIAFIFFGLIAFASQGARTMLEAEMIDRVARKQSQLLLLHRSTFFLRQL